MIFGPIGDGFGSENINPVHQKNVLGPIGNGFARNTVMSENTNSVHQKKVLCPIGSGSARNTGHHDARMHRICRFLMCVAWGVFTRTLSLFVTPKDTNDQGSIHFPSQHQFPQEFKFHMHYTIQGDTNVDI